MAAPVLVTGATGNVGRFVVADLLAAGVPVRAAASTAESVRRAFGDTVEPVALDFTDPATWPAAYRGVPRMFLLRPPQLGRPRRQLIPSLEAARRAGVRQVVLLSLQGAEHNRMVPHHAIETWLRGSGLAWTFVRASFFMQNLTTTHRGDIRDRDEIRVPAGDGATSFVDAADVAAVAAAALLDPQRHRDRAWTPTGPAALTYAQVAETLSDVLGRRIRYPRPGALRYALHARRTLGMPWVMVGVTTAIYSVARLGRAASVTADVREVTGRDPLDLRRFAEREQALWRPGDSCGSGV